MRTQAGININLCMNRWVSKFNCHDFIPEKSKPQWGVVHTECVFPLQLATFLLFFNVNMLDRHVWPLCSCLASFEAFHFFRCDVELKELELLLTVVLIAVSSKAVDQSEKFRCGTIVASFCLQVLCGCVRILLCFLIPFLNDMSNFFRSREMYLVWIRMSLSVLFAWRTRWRRISSYDWPHHLSIKQSAKGRLSGNILVSTDTP